MSGKTPSRRARSPSPTRPSSSSQKTAAAKETAAAAAAAAPGGGNHIVPPKCAPHEFGGVIGTAILVLFMPFIILSLKIFCNRDFCLETWDVAALKASIPQHVSDYITLEVVVVFALWVGFVALLERFLPADVVEGLPLRNGHRLKYRLNGHLSFWVVVVVADHWHQLGNGFTLSWIYNNYLQLAVVSVIASFLLSLYLYLRSLSNRHMLAVGGNSGYVPYDFFLGRELNPRWGDFDIKLFVEMRLGLIGWILLELAMVAKQYETIGTVSNEMLLVVSCHLLYVWDALYSERAVLSTMDITTDGLGFMLTFGDIVWVPFGFSLQARYLVDHNPALSPFMLAVAALLMGGGYYLFRGANAQKDLFRTDPTHPDVAHLKFMRTQRGTALLISGFWGLARKINYTGDLMMALSWCLPCGFSSPIPYFYFFYLLFLLIHRSIRDNDACQAKYGKDWDKYKELVPYVFIPYVI